MIEEIKKTIEVLRVGGVILYPTDTVWALGCDATNESAVLKLLKIKSQLSHKPMIVLVDNVGKIASYVDKIPELAWDLVEFSENPLTIVYPNARNLAQTLLGDDKSVAIRITKEAFSKRLCEQFRKPVVSTSANFNTDRTPMNFSEVSEKLKAKVDYVVDFRRDDFTKRKTSTILKLEMSGIFQIVRE